MGGYWSSDQAYRHRRQAVMGASIINLVRSDGHGAFLHGPLPIRHECRSSTAYHQSGPLPFRDQST
jgi:hypothetical protein